MDIRSNCGRLLLAAILALCAIGVKAAGPTLSLAAALQLAQQRSLQLGAQDAAAAAARDLAHAAGRLPDPTVKAGLNNVPVDGPDAWSLTRDFMTMRSIGVMQEFTREGKRQARSARFEREADAAEAARTLALAQLRRDTAISWLERHYLERQIELLRAQRAEAALQVDAAEAAYRGGNGSQADVFAMRAAVALADDGVRSVEIQASAARTRLQRWVGAAAAWPLVEPPALQLDSGSAELAAKLIEEHPQIALLSRQEAMARADAEIARSEQSVDWSVELSYSQRGPSYSNMASLNVSVPLQWDAKNRQDRQVAARLNQAEQLRAEREEAQRELLAEIQVWLEQWHGDRERLVFYDQQIIPLAAERNTAALVAYRGGTGTLSSVLEARRLEIGMRVDRLRLERDNAVLWARLEYLLPPDGSARNALAQHRPDVRKETQQ